MSSLRRIWAEGLRGGIVAVLFAYMLFLQGLVVAYAQGMMAAPGAGQVFVICSPLGTTNPDGGQPTGKLTHDCCPAFCHAGCSIGSTIIPIDLGATADWRSPQQSRIVREAPRVARGLLCFSQTARGPPSSSI